MEPSKLAVLKDKFGDKLRVAAMAAIVKPGWRGKTLARCYALCYGEPCYHI